jgi:outer membrane protein assembly factor BamB
MTAVLLASAVGGLAYIWAGWDPLWGRGAQLVISYAIGLATAAVLVVWFACFSGYSWRTVLTGLAVLAVSAAGFAASIRSLEFSGDMDVIAHFRWEQTQAERVAAHRRQQSPDGQPPVIPDVVPLESDEDMPAYRGVRRDGVLVGPPLRTNWDAQPPGLLWRQPCGGGYASFAVRGDRLVTIEQRGPQEVVACYDTTDGRELWAQAYTAEFTEAMGGPGPRSTPTIAADSVYSLGAQGDLYCLDLSTGAIRWHRDILPDGLPNAEWGLCSSPLVWENQVIVEAGGPQGDGLISLHRETGDVLWERPGVAGLTEPAAKNRAGYSSPMVVTLLGEPQLLMFDGEGLRSHVPTTGELLWFHEFKNGAGVNVAQPVVLGEDRVFLSMSYGEGCRLIRVQRSETGWSPPETLWQNIHLRCKFTSPVVHEGFLYGLDEGILVCLDPETGERRWKQGRYGHGQILLTNNQLLVLSEKGEAAIVEPNPEACRELARYRVLPTAKVWNPPALSRGRLYVRSHAEMAAFELTDG